MKLIWATPDIDRNIAYMARVSNPSGQGNPEFSRLLRYLMNNGHVSPFEMANACLEIETTRDIARQILRHRSFSFQEFSGRYAQMSFGDLREARLQDCANRQNSLECLDEDLSSWWLEAQEECLRSAKAVYNAALKLGIAKEQARAVLPEGLTVSRLYMNGNLRSWIFYLTQRLDPSTQKEHRLLAKQILELLRGVAPVTMGAFFDESYHC